MPQPTTTFKVVFFFGDGRYGWSENYFTQAQSGANITVPPNSPYSVLPQTIKLASARAAMLARGAAPCGFGNQGGSNAPALEYIRISTVGALRITAFYDPQSGEIINGMNLPPSITTNPLTNSQVLATVPPDNPYSCVEMVCGLGNGLVSKRPLSGVPDMDICDQSRSASSTSAGVSSGWEQLWKQFAALLTQGNVWGTISNSPFSNAGNLNAAWQPILNIANGLDGHPTLSYELPLNFAIDASGCPDYRVMIKCFRPMQGHNERLNGVYRVSTPSPGNIGSLDNPLDGFRVTLKRVMVPLYPFNYGYISAYNGGVFTPFLSASLTRVVARKRGRPFGLVRGRSAVVR